MILCIVLFRDFKGDEDAKMRAAAITVPNWFEIRREIYFDNNSNVRTDEGEKYKKRCV